MSLERITKMAELMLNQKERVDELTEQLSNAKQNLLELETVHLPELMAEVGITSITLKTGDTVSVSEDVSASITQAKAPMAYRWLRDNGFGGLIRCKLIREFDDADEAEKALEETGDARLEESVHNATLKSFVKEQIAAGTDIPFDLFGIHPYSKATLKKGKKNGSK